MSEPDSRNNIRPCADGPVLPSDRRSAVWILDGSPPHGYAPETPPDHRSDCRHCQSSLPRVYGRCSPTCRTPNRRFPDSRLRYGYAGALWTGCRSVPPAPLYNRHLYGHGLPELYSSCPCAGEPQAPADCTRDFRFRPGRRRHACESQHPLPPRRPKRFFPGRSPGYSRNPYVCAPESGTAFPV